MIILPELKKLKKRLVLDDFQKKRDRQIVPDPNIKHVFSMVSCAFVSITHLPFKSILLKCMGKLNTYCHICFRLVSIFMSFIFKLMFPVLCHVIPT